MLGGTLEDPSYSDVREKHEIKFDSDGGWLGITDKYWMAAVIPPQNEKFAGRYLDRAAAPASRSFGADYLMARARRSRRRPRRPSRIASLPDRRSSSLLNAYEDNLRIDRFNMAIDWGWFFFLTKPMFCVLDWIYKLIGNFGIAILGLTVVIKGTHVPARQPRVRIDDEDEEDLSRRSKSCRSASRTTASSCSRNMMALYRREKINPMSGCLPMLIQIPVFFALYKVLFVTIEMRHAPFFGWIHDLSAADPTNLFTLFGLLPFAHADRGCMIGIWPLLMGMTMFYAAEAESAGRPIRCSSRC